MIACILANVNRDTKKKKQPFEITDFMPTKKGSKPQKQQSDEDIEQTVRILQQTLGGELK